MRAGREIRTRLLDWTQGHTDAENLAAKILDLSGYEDIDPAHPRGGPDGKKDILCTKENILWVGAVYFPVKPQSFSRIKNKFKVDLPGVKANRALGIVFITNQEVTVGQREVLVQLASNTGVKCDIIHFDRLVTILEKPEAWGLRLEYLDIKTTTEEFLAYHAWSQKHQQKIITKLADTGRDRDSYVSNQVRSGIHEEPHRSSLSLSDSQITDLADKISLRITPNTTSSEISLLRADKQICIAALVTPDRILATALIADKSLLALAFPEYEWEIELERLQKTNAFDRRTKGIHLKESIERRILSHPTVEKVLHQIWISRLKVLMIYPDLAYLLAIHYVAIGNIELGTNTLVEGAYIADTYWLESVQTLNASILNHAGFNKLSLLARANVYRCSIICVLKKGDRKRAKCLLKRLEHLCNTCNSSEFTRILWLAKSDFPSIDSSDKAEKWFSEAVEITGKIDLWTKGVLLRRYGLLLIQMGRPQEARIKLNESKILFEELGDKTETLKSQEHLTSLLFQEEVDNSLIEEFECMVDLGWATGNLRSVAIAYRDLSTYYNMQGKHKKALVVLERTVLLNENPELNDLRGELLYNLAVTYHAEGHEKSKAHGTALRAKAEAKRTCRYDTLCQISLLLAQVAHSQEYFNERDVYLKDSIEMGFKYGYNKALYSAALYWLKTKPRSRECVNFIQDKITQQPTALAAEFTLNLVSGLLDTYTDEYDTLIFEFLRIVNDKLLEMKFDNDDHPLLLWLNLASIYWDCNKFDDAITTLQKAKEASKQKCSNDGKFAILNQLGMWYQELDEYETALNIHEESKRFAEHELNIEAQYNNEGECRRKLGDFEGAMSTLKRAELLAKKRGDLKNILLSRHNIALVYQEIGDFKKASDIFGTCIRMARNNKFTDVYLNARFGRANLYHAWGKSAKAVREFSTIFDEANDEKRAEIAINYSESLVVSQESTKAVAILDGINASLLPVPMQIRFYLQWARCCDSAKLYNQAQEYAEKSFQLATDSGLEAFANLASDAKDMLDIAICCQKLNPVGLLQKSSDMEPEDRFYWLMNCLTYVSEKQQQDLFNSLQQICDTQDNEVWKAELLLMSAEFNWDDGGKARVVAPEHYALATIFSFCSQDFELTTHIASSFLGRMVRQIRLGRRYPIQKIRDRLIKWCVRSKVSPDVQHLVMSPVRIAMSLCKTFTKNGAITVYDIDKVCQIEGKP